MRYLIQRQLGFSLVEIMVGMTLGLFLTIGIIQLYIGSNRNYRFQEEFSRIQENGRFALELLNNTIRMANFTGCMLSGTPSPQVQNMLNNNNNGVNPSWWVDVNSELLPPLPPRPAWEGMLKGFDGTQVFPGQAFGISSARDRISGTDAIISLGGSGNYPILDSNEETFTIGQITRANGRSLQKGDLMLVCNTTNVSLFQITSDLINPQFVIAHAAVGVPGNSNIAPNPDLVVVYSPTESAITDYVPTAFYIGVSNSETTRSLFQMQLQVTDTGVASMQAEEMVEGVENMQIFYAEDINEDRVADVYRDATNVTDWSQVVSVRIELLLASMENNVLSEPQTYFFPNDIGDSATTGRSVTATDKRWYQTFSTTIGIRNRLK